jgi:hypothetical protein
MNTKQLVSLIKRNHSQWSRTDILEFIDNIQKTVFGVPVSIMRYRDITTGLDKVLETVSGTLEYELSVSNFGADIQFIESVYPLDYDSTYYNKYSANDISASVKNAIGTTNAKVLFSENPGDSSFYIKCYKRPTALLSEAIDLGIPENLIIPGLYKGVVGLLETTEHGESNAYDRFIKEYMVSMRAQMNDEGQTLVYYNQGGGY